MSKESGADGTEPVPEQVRKQIRYYFSDTNLPNDRFLRKEMKKNPDGYVKIEIIARFKKMTTILPSKDVATIAEYLKEESTVEVNEAKDGVRRSPALPALPNDGEPEVSEFLEVPKRSMGFIIGKAGATIKEMQKQTGAEIYKTEEKDGMVKMAVEGSVTAVQAAKDLIQEKLKAAEKGDATEVKLGEQSFRSPEELVTKVKSLQDKHSNDEEIPAEECSMLTALLKFHPSGEAKVGCGVKGFKVGNHPDYEDSQCFFVLRTDGTEEDFSAQKCVTAVFGERKGGKRKRGKDDRDEEPEPEPEERILVPGLVLKVSGMESKPDFKQAKEVFRAHGNVHFVQIEEDNSMLVRFEKAEEAAMAASKITDFEGTAVSCALVSGEEEQAYWEKAWSMMDSAAKKGKGGGKGGKGKGGKGKGGKGKGGKGKRQRN